MIRRLLTAVSLTLVVSGGLVAAAGTASAHDESVLCVGGPNQRDPSRYTGVCVGPDMTVAP